MTPTEQSSPPASSATPDGMSLIRRNLRHRLDLRIFVLVLSFSVLLSLFTTALWVWSDYRRQVAAIQASFDRIEKGFLTPLAHSLWEKDEDDLVVEVQGIRAQPDIAYVRVTTRTGQLVAAGTPVIHDAISREVPVYYQQAQVGSLLVQSDPGRSLAATISAIGPIYLFQLVMISGVAAFFFILFSQMITRHMVDISGYLAKIGVSLQQPPLVLMRRRRGDELDLVADAINRMRDDLLVSQQARAESAEMFSRTFYAAPLLMTISRLDDGTYLEVNDTFVKISGFTREEAIGRRSVDLGWIAAPDRDALKMDLLAGGRIVGKKLTLRAKDGTEVVCLFFGEIISFSNKTCLLSIAMDITDRLRTEDALRESEERYRDIFEESKAVMLVIDPTDGKIVDANPAAAAYYGYALEKLLSLTMSDINTLTHEEVRAEMELAVTEERNAFHFRHRLASGEEREVDVFSSSISHHGREYLFSIIQDVTERVRAEQYILGLNEDLEQRVVERTAQLSAANHELESFSYSVSHDLRAPVRHVYAFARMLEEESAACLPPDSLHYLQRIVHSATLMGEMIEGLLQISRLNRTPMNVTTVDLSAMAEEVADDLGNEAATRRVEWLIAPGIEAVGDPVLLRVVLQNLLGNAWKYSAKKEVARIEFGVVDQGYFVRDNGAGFDNDYADKLFLTFQRLHGSEEFAGIGIGLATVHRIIQRHGGKVWADGVVDGGATFYFTLAEQVPTAHLDQ